MTEKPNRTRDELKAQMLELIKDKSADSSVVLNTIIILGVLPVLEDIAQRLEWICTAIAPDEKYANVADRIREITNVLQHSVNQAEREKK
jgi:hypothetical protein